MPKEKPLFKIKIEAPTLKKGHIPVSLLLRICQDAQDAVEKQADAIKGGIGKLNEREGAKKQAITLELIGLRKGSTFLDFAEAPTKQMDLGYMNELPPLGVEAVADIAELLRSANKNRAAWGDRLVPGVLDALNDMGELLKEGVDSFKWIIPPINGGRSKSTPFTPSTLSRIKEKRQEINASRRTATAKTVTLTESFLDGMLEVGDGKCRIEPLMGEPLTVTYGADQATKVLEAQHKPVRVKIDQQRKLVDISLKDEGTMDSNLFFQAKTIEELIAEQGVQPVISLEAVAGWIPNEDVDAFLDAIYSDRPTTSV